METVLRGAAIYIVVLAMVRIAGRRSLAQMTPFDLVLMLIIAETTQQALLGDDFSITNAVVLIATLFGIDIALSYVKEYWPLAGAIIDGRPTLLVADGKGQERALKRTRVNMDDIMAAARAAGLERPDQIRHAVLETNGEISIIPRKEESG